MVIKKSGKGGIDPPDPPKSKATKPTRRSLPPPKKGKSKPKEKIPRKPMVPKGARTDGNGEMEPLELPVSQEKLLEMSEREAPGQGHIVAAAVKQVLFSIYGTDLPKIREQLQADATLAVEGAVESRVSSLLRQVLASLNELSHAAMSKFNFQLAEDKHFKFQSMESAMQAITAVSNAILQAGLKGVEIVQRDKQHQLSMETAERIAGAEGPSRAVLVLPAVVDSSSFETVQEDVHGPIETHLGIPEDRVPYDDEEPDPDRGSPWVGRGGGKDIMGDFLQRGRQRMEENEIPVFDVSAEEVDDDDA